jgi:hypothetical protein
MLLEVAPGVGAVGKPLLAFAARMLALSKAIVDLPERPPIHLLISPHKFVKDIETERDTNVSIY